MKRTIDIDGRKTGVSLEDAFWQFGKGNRAGQRYEPVEDGYRARQDAPTRQPVLRYSPVRPRPGSLTKSGGHHR